MTDIQLDYAVPGAAVARHFTLFYLFRAEVPLFEDVERADHAQIRFRLTPGGAEYGFADGNVQTAGDIHIIGPTTGAFHVRAPGPVHVFGAGITPVGWAALVGNDASAMVNRVVNLSDLFGSAISEAIPRLNAAPDLEAMTACAEDILTGLFRRRSDRAADFVRQVDAWLSDEASPEVEALAAATGLSRRQIERKCNRLYGMPPKLLARKYRALRAAVACILDQDQAHDGFYDQSHLIRDVREFTGLTPRQLKSQPGLIASLSVGLRHNLTGRIDPLVSDA